MMKDLEFQLSIIVGFVWNHLQKKGLLRAEVLKTTGGAKSQLEKYINADW